MEAITILRELWRLRYLVFLGAMLALAIGLMTAYRISLAPPKLESRQYHVGRARQRWRPAVARPPRTGPQRR